MEMFPIIILAGGKATRLGSLTENTPKSLLMFNGKPFLQHQIELLKKNNFNRIHLCLGEFSEIIIDFINYNNNFNIDITYSVDKPLLGTAGAIDACLETIKSEYFFVIYGDSYVDMDYKDMQIEYDDCAQFSMMSIYKNNNKFDKSNINIIDNGFLVSYQNRGANLKYIDAGVSIYDKYVFEPEYLFCSYLPSNLKDIQGIISNFDGVSEIAPYIIKDRFYEVGSVEGIQEFQKYLDEKNE